MDREQDDVRGGATAPATATQTGKNKSRKLLWIVIAVLIFCLFLWWRASHNSDSAKKTNATPPPVPVLAGTVEKKNVPIYLDGIGTVQAYNTVTVHVRVDGQLVKVGFNEGQDVKAGDLLVQIDPAPFQTVLNQATAKKNQDEAQLANAKLDLKRDEDLIAKKVISGQQYDTQKALVAQLDATVKSDQAAVDNAQVQLNYTTVTSPIDGRTGIRQVDLGNIVHAADANGIVVITQLHPIYLLFTLPEQSLADIHTQLAKQGSLDVLAVDRDNKKPIATGTLSVIDNQIDTTTGTIKIKATFSNDDLQLWPGEFVNARLHLDTRKDGLVVPAQVIQHGPNGSYVFVIKPDQTVEIRPVKVAQVDGGEALIDQGLQAGEQVVVDGQYKLQDGSHVKLNDPSKKPKSAPKQGELQ